MSEASPMPEIPQDTKPENAKAKAPLLSRRGFLRTALIGLTGLTAKAVVPEFLVTKKAEAQGQLEALVTEIEAMTLSEQEQILFQEFPVIPDVQKIAERLREITDIPKGSMLMKSGTSVAWGMLASLYGKETKQDAIDFGEDQAELQKVLEFLQIPAWALDICAVSGVDATQLIHDSYTCMDSMNNKFKPFEVDPMPCLPNVGVNESYIQHFQPKVAINFVGTNMIRNGDSLAAFGNSVTELIEFYLSKKIIPILTTFPQPKNTTDPRFQQWFTDPQLYVDPAKDEAEVIQAEKEKRKLFLPENAFKYNVLLLKLAELYQIPIINTERGVVEDAENDGTVTTEYNGETDPIHFSRLLEMPPIEIPAANEKFRFGEQAVSFYTVKTLAALLEVVGTSGD